MRDTKPLLFVNDDQPQVFEGNVFREQPMRPHQNVHFATFKFGESLFLFFGCAKPRHHFNRDRKRRKPLAKGLPMLKGQHGGRSQNRHLF